MSSRFDIGFRVVGHRTARRRPVQHSVAFAAHAACDPRAELEREAYLSFFVFDGAFAEHLERNGSEAAYGGPCGASWLWWDIDRPDDLQAALSDARRLAGFLLERYHELDDDDVLVCFSGAKGLHVGIPATWRPEPSPTFNIVAKLFCLELAEQARVAVDGSIYTKTRLLRAPNSRHPKTGLHKRRLSLDELTYLSLERILDLAREPAPFDVPSGPATCPKAADDWREAERAAERRAQRRPEPCQGGKLQALTRDFLINGAPDGEREVRLFRASANLGEFDCPADLAHALLTEPALDSGLTPSETKRAIDGGLAHARRQREGGAA